MRLALLILAAVVVVVTATPSKLAATWLACHPTSKNPDDDHWKCKWYHFGAAPAATNPNNNCASRSMGDSWDWTTAAFGADYASRVNSLGAKMGANSYWNPQVVGDQTGYCDKQDAQLALPAFGWSWQRSQSLSGTLAAAPTGTYWYGQVYKQLTYGTTPGTAGGQADCKKNVDEEADLTGSRECDKLARCGVVAVDDNCLDTEGESELYAATEAGRLQRFEAFYDDQIALPFTNWKPSQWFNSTLSGCSDSAACKKEAQAMALEAMLHPVVTIDNVTVTKVFNKWWNPSSLATVTAGDVNANNACGQWFFLKTWLNAWPGFATSDPGTTAAQITNANANNRWGGAVDLPSTAYSVTSGKCNVALCQNKPVPQESDAANACSSPRGPLVTGAKYNNNFWLASSFTVNAFLSSATAFTRRSAEVEAAVDMKPAVDMAPAAATPAAATPASPRRGVARSLLQTGVEEVEVVPEPIAWTVADDIAGLSKEFFTRHAEREVVVTAKFGVCHTNNWPTICKFSIGVDGEALGQVQVVEVISCVDGGLGDVDFGSTPVYKTVVQHPNYPHFHRASLLYNCSDDVGIRAAADNTPPTVTVSGSNKCSGPLLGAPSRCRPLCIAGDAQCQGPYTGKPWETWSP